MIPMWRPGIFSSFQKLALRIELSNGVLGSSVRQREAEIASSRRLGRPTFRPIHFGPTWFCPILTGLDEKLWTKKGWTKIGRTKRLVPWLPVIMENSSNAYILHVKRSTGGEIHSHSAVVCSLSYWEDLGPATRFTPFAIHKLMSGAEKRGS